MLRRFLNIAGFVVLTTSSVVHAGWDDVLAAWRATAESNGGVRLRFVETVFSSQPLAKSPDGRVVFSEAKTPIEYRREVDYVADGRRWKLDSNGSAWELSLSQVVQKRQVDCWNGDIRTAFDRIEGKPSLIRCPGWMSSHDAACMFRIMPQHIPLVLLTQPTAAKCSLFDPVDWIAEGEMVSTEDVAGSLLKQRLTSKRWAQVVATVIVNHNPPFLLRRYERGGLTVSVDYTAHPEFGVVPKRWKVTELTQDKGAVHRDTLMEVETIELRCKLEDSDFQVEFPPGTVVQDASKSEISMFFVRNDGSRREITESEWVAGIDYDRLTGSEPGTLTGRSAVPKNKASYWRILTINGVIVAAVLVAIAVRAYRRRF